MGKPANECVLKFLELPITEAIFNRTFESENKDTGLPSVLMDTSNPAQTQLAILAKTFEDQKNSPFSPEIVEKLKTKINKRAQKMVRKYEK